MPDSNANFQLRGHSEKVFHGMLLDMDGTLLDTEHISHKAWRLAEKETQIELREGLLDEVVGLAMNRIIQTLKEALGSAHAADRLFQVAFRNYQRLLHDEPVPVKSGAESLLLWLDEARIPRCLASSSQRFLVDHKLHRSGLAGWIPQRVCGDEVDDSKPHPEIYELAAARLGLRPEDCLAIEDSANGILSATEAGCRVVHVPDMAPVDEGCMRRVWKRFDSLDELRSSLIVSSKTAI